MSRPKNVVLSAELHEYLVAHGSPPDPVACELIARTRALGDPAEMQIPPEQRSAPSPATRRCAWPEDCARAAG
jgi:hypothetical protein